LLIVLALAAAGCGAGDGRFQVFGSVTYKGQPVPKGHLVFEPDTDQGNAGPGSGARIESGQYRTPPGQGVVGGPHRVKIVGYDGVPTTEEGEELPQGRSLFVPYVTTVDFPKADVRQDFEVP
jgi:hypothetical protein